MALLIHEKPQIFNTDQGSQFTSKEHTSVKKKHCIKISIYGKGRAIDNIFIERFWRSLKQEYVYLHKPNGGFSVYKGIEEYMRFYNYERKHKSLKKKKPAEVYYGKLPIFKQTKYLTSLV